ncbi:MAG: flavodoxin [candidate division Zixibacteria bacterium 4484_93]|nr:MAG: flavodoxin [candidate division Zixibacteria bacterium 4484_93]
MRILIVYSSFHHGNTAKIAQAMADEVKAELAKPGELDVDRVREYDILGFGSGIYFWRHHRAIFKLVEKLPNMRGKRAFIFSTRGAGPISIYHKPLKRELLRKGFKIIGEFSCLGYDTFAYLKLIGGISKGHPDKKDIKKARDFARRLVKSQ